MRFVDAGGVGLVLYGLVTLMEVFFSCVYIVYGNRIMCAITAVGIVVWAYCFFKRLDFVRTTMDWIKQTQQIK